MHLNLERFRAADSAQFTQSHGPLTSQIVYRNLSKHVKTTCGFVNVAIKAEIAQRKVFFFSLSYKSFPFRPDLNSSLARSAGERWPLRKGMFSSPDWGLWVLKFSPIFGVLSIMSATDMLESHSRALKTQILP